MKINNIFFWQVPINHLKMTIPKIKQPSQAGMAVHTQDGEFQHSGGRDRRISLSGQSGLQGEFRTVRATWKDIVSTDRILFRLLKRGNF